MVESMTGFGRGVHTTDEGVTVVEVRSVNNRFLDVSVRGVRESGLVETRMREGFRKHLERGKVSVSVVTERHGAGRPAANMDRAEAYLVALGELKEKLGLAGDVDLSLLAGFRDVLNDSGSEEDEDEEAAWSRIQPAFAEALSGLVDMRAREGEALATDISDRLKMLAGSLSRVTERAPERTRSYMERLRERMAELLGEREIAEERLLQEVALYADRIDISEECTRLNSHLEQAEEVIKGSGAGGRALNFLLQEMHREVNTIGSKANDPEINYLVVGMKEELEKIREQVQNIE